MTATLIGCPEPPVDRYDLALLDLDGVVYVGTAAVPGAAAVLGRIRASGLRVSFVTNNASRTPGTIAAHLCELGIQAAADDVVTSAQAAASLFARQLPSGSAVLVVGGEGLYAALRERHLEPVASMDDDPVAVVQGFSPDVGWRLLAEGTRGVRAGLPWIATNTDLTVPTEHGPAPGNGTLVAAVAAASGARPQVAGKPQPPLFQEAQHRYGSSRPLVIGDRLDTDLEGARAAGMDGLLVLTGVTRVAGLLNARPPERPHLISRDLHGMLETHPEPERVGTDSYRCREAVVRAGRDDLQVQAAGNEPLDLLRAACAATWQAADDGRAADPLDPGPLLVAMGSIDGSGGWDG